MGLFDRFKKKQEPKVMLVAPVQSMRRDVSIDEFIGKDGKRYIEVNHYNANADFKDLYDSTRLIVRKDPTILPSGEMVYDAQVSWYGENDAVMFDENGKDMGRRNQMTAIKLGIDMEKLLSEDKMYHIALMRDLLKQDRVRKYIEQGMQDNPAQPCGNYIGQIALKRDEQTDKMYYRKRFMVSIGKEIHYSPEQVAAREQHKQKQERIKQGMIADRQARIQRLQSEIDDLSK